MQKKSPSKGMFIGIIVIAVVALGIYFYYKGTPTDETSSLETSVTPESADAQAAANRVLVLLNTISSLRIDDSLFKTAVYKSLVDYTITIPEQNVGRPNPFAPVGSGSTASTGRLPGTTR